MFYFSPSSLICLGGRAFSFKKDDENIFVVGTESGMIYLGTTQVLLLLKGTVGVISTPNRYQIYRVSQKKMGIQ